MDNPKKTKRDNAHKLSSIRYHRIIFIGEGGGALERKTHHTTGSNSHVCQSVFSVVTKARCFHSTHLQTNLDPIEKQHWGEIKLYNVERQRL